MARLGRTLRTTGALVGLWVAARRAVRLERPRRHALAAELARRTIRALALDLRVRGRVPVERPFLLVANHVSWLDVYVLNAVGGAMRFVAKRETASWPVVGDITRAFDTIFIVRGSVRDAARVRTAVAAALRAGESVAVFPEGTTTDGSTLRRFHGALFQAAIDAGAAVVPVALRYARPDGTPTTAAAFVDDMTFLGSLARVLGEPELLAVLEVGEPIAAAGWTRRALARHCRAFVAAALALPAAALEPEVTRPAARSTPRAA